MKRTTPAIAALALALSLIAGSAYAGEPSPTPSEIRTPWTSTVGRGCQEADTSHLGYEVHIFTYSDGYVIAHDLAEGVSFRVAGDEVAGDTARITAGTFAVEYEAPAGSVFFNGETRVSEIVVVKAATPCAKPANRVKVGKWHVSRRTAHSVTLRRAVRVTRWISDEFSDHAGGQWLPKVKVSHETKTRHRR